MTTDDRTTGDGKDITLRDVIAHIQSLKYEFQTGMQGMEKRLTMKIDANTRDIQENTRAIVQNSADIQDLGLRITALDEDLTATIKDTYNIRQHVGMVSVDD